MKLLLIEDKIMINSTRFLCEYLSSAIFRTIEICRPVESHEDETDFIIFIKEPTNNY